MKIAVVILNWNGKSFLEMFLPGVVKHTAAVAEVIIADNNSSDDSVEWLKEHFPDVRIIRNTVNGGFAKGYNDALAQVDADYYILLNSDIEVTENWIMPVINLMQQHSEIAACQPKILAYDDKERFEYAGAAGGFIDYYGYPFCRGRVFLEIEKDNGQYDQSCEVFWATGACFFIKAELFHAAGGFDEDFFAHMEEIDLCWRLKRMGYAIYYCADAKVFHVGGGTLPKRSAKKTYLNFRNNLILLYKNLPGKRIYPVFFFRTILDGVAALKFLVSAGFADFVAVFKAHLHFYMNLRRDKGKRSSLSNYYVSGIYKGNLVYQHYIKGVKTFSQLKRSKFTSTGSKVQ